MSLSTSEDAGKSYEYINDFLFFVIKPDQGTDSGSYIYCSGADLFRFLPITKGRHGLDSNPAMRGLQLVNLGVREMALSQQVTIRPVRGDCAGMAHNSGAWYSERLLIENAPASFPEEVITYGVINLVKKIIKACTARSPLTVALGVVQRASKATRSAPKPGGGEPPSPPSAPSARPRPGGRQFSRERGFATCRYPP